MKKGKNENVSDQEGERDECRWPTSEEDRRLTWKGSELRTTWGREDEG